MERYLALFDEAIIKQAELVGRYKAHMQARASGLKISREGHVISFVGNPMVVLLRLIRSFTEDGNLAALDACAPLINRMTEIPADLEKAGE